MSTNNSINKKNYKLNLVFTILMCVILAVFYYSAMIVGLNTLLGAGSTERKPNSGLLGGLSVAFLVIFLCALIALIVLDIINYKRIKKGKMLLLSGKTRTLLFWILFALILIAYIGHELCWILGSSRSHNDSTFNLVAMYSLVAALPCYIVALVNYPRAVKNYHASNDAVKEKKKKLVSEEVTSSWGELKKHPGQIFLIVASCLVIVSIFTFFLKYLGGEILEFGAPYDGNVFTFAFINRFVVDYKDDPSLVNGALLFVLISLIILIVINIISLAFRKRKHIKWSIFLSAFSAIFTFVNAIVVLNSKHEWFKIEGVKLGAGPILFAVCSFIAFACYLAGIIMECISNPSMRKVFANFAKKGEYTSTTKEIKSSKKVDKKDNKVDVVKTLKEYKQLYDAGVITKKEFDDKKKELLK